MTVKMQGPDNHGGFSHDGESYTPDTSGLIEVPHEAVTAAFDHGFALVAEKAAKPAKTDDDGDKPDAAKNEKAKPAEGRKGA